MCVFLLFSFFCQRERERKERKNHASGERFVFVCRFELIEHANKFELAHEMISIYLWSQRFVVLAEKRNEKTRWEFSIERPLVRVGDKKSVRAQEKKLIWYSIFVQASSGNFFPSSACCSLS